jgi:DNA-binding protein Fis
MKKNNLKEVSKEGLADCVKEHINKFIYMLDGDISKGNLYDIVIKEVEKPLIETILLYTGYNQIKAAKILGINRNTLRKK